MLLGAFAVADAALSTWDAYDTYQAISNECASTSEKWIAGGLFAAGVVLPGSYGWVDDAAKINLAKGTDAFVDLASPQRRRHVLDGDATGGGHRPGTGKPGKSEFPQGWSDDKIMYEISDIATDPNVVRRSGRRGRTISEGTRDGVNIRVGQERDGDIASGFPTNVRRNPR